MEVTAKVGELKDHSLLKQVIEEAIRNHEFSLIVIFPTLSLLRAIQEELLDQPQIRGIGGFRFLLFEGFIGELREQFGLNSNTATPLERDLILQSVLCQLESEGELNYLNRIPYTFNYRKAILDGMSEWKRSGLTPELFAEWSLDKGAKQQELALVYELYQARMIDLGLTDDDLTLDELQRLRMTDSGPESSATPSSRIILYGFTDLTPLQMDYIKALEVWYNFSAIIDPTAVPEFRQLAQKYFPYHEIKFSVAASSGHALHTLQNRFWAEEACEFSIDPRDDSLGIIQAAGNRQAVGIAREISKIIRSGEGYGSDDFLILAPQPQAFIQMAEPIFKEYQLEVSDAALPIRETAVVNRFLHTLGLVLNDWQWPDMQILIHHLYRGTVAGVGDRLLIFLAETYGAISGKERWVKLCADDQLFKELTELQIDPQPLKSGIEQLEKLIDSDTYRNYFEYARQWLVAESELILNASNVNMPLPEEKLNYQAARELITAVSALLDTEIGRLLMDATITLRDFRKLFEEQLLEIEIKPIQGLADGIRVISPREVRGLTARVVFITGLEEGSFPRYYVNDWKLDASDRFDLKTLGVEMENGENYQIQEKLSFYWGLQAATEKLYFVYRDQNADGQLTNISPFLNDVFSWFPDLHNRIQVYHLEPEVCSSFDACYSRLEQQQLWVVYSLSSGKGLDAAEHRIYRQLFNQPVFRGLGESVRYWSNYRHSDRYQPFGVNPMIRELLDRTYGEESCIGITAIEDYLSCPYRFFLKHFLKIRPITEGSILPEALDLGNLYHQVFAQFGTIYRDQALTREKLPEYRACLAQLLSETITRWKENAANDLIRAMLSAQTAETERTVERWIQAEVEWSELTASRFRPYIVEYAFGRSSGDCGGEKSLPCFILNDGSSQIKLAGRIDRIDRDTDNNFIIYDYKLGRGGTGADLKSLRKIQLPAYLLVAEDLLFGKGKAVGGAYLGLRDPSRSRGGIWAKEKLGLNWRSNGELDEDEWQAWLSDVRQKLIDAVRNIRAGSFRLTEEDCLAYCEYSNCCRRQEREVEMVGTFTE